MSLTPRSRGRFGWLIHLALIVICAAALLPFLWMVSTSLKTLQGTLEYPPRWIPSPVQWHNYLDLFRNPRTNFLLWTRNTLVILPVLAIFFLAQRTFIEGIATTGSKG